MNTSRHNPIAVSIALALSGGVALQAGYIRNASFESNYNETWPHYSPVDEWAGASGVNDASGPFHNGGTPVPDRGRIGFKQGTGDVTQDISGLVDGQTYWLQFFYDGRRGGGSSQSLVVKFNDTEIGAAPDIIPSNAGYYFMSAPFTAVGDSGTIRFSHTAVGDRTLLLDGVTIVKRGATDIVLRNPSFEASGALPAAGAVTAIAGWTQTGAVGVDDGTAGYADNGTIPDQDLVAFIEGEGSLVQQLDGLIVGNEYEVKILANARNGTAPRLRISLAGASLKEQDVTPGGYQEVNVKFTATATTAALGFEQVKAGSDVLLLDEARLLGVVRPPLPPMTFAPLASEVSPGDTIRYTLSIPGAAIESGPVSIRLGSANPNIGRFVNAAPDGTLTLEFGASAGATEPVPGAALWLKADAISGVANGAKLASWPDSSGQNRPAANATEANQPTFIANGVAGKPVVRFDDLGNDFVAGGVQWLDTAADVQTKNGASYSAFIVFRSDEDETTAAALEGRDNLLQPLDVGAGNVGRTVLFLDTPGGTRKLTSVSAQGSVSSTSTYTPGRWAQAAVIQDATAANLALFLDGSPEGSGSMGPEGGLNAGWRIGATKQGHGGLRGDVAEVIVYSRALNETERKQVEGYLAAKWSLPKPTSASFTMTAVSRGSFSINVLESGRIPVSSTPRANVVSSFVKNASFESSPAAAFPGYGPVLGWSGTGNTGLNRAGGPDQPAGPFGDNGLVPDREQVAFIQGNGSLSQQINGLTQGRSYWLQFRYNARNCCGERNQSLVVRFAGQDLATYTDVVPVADQGEVSYYNVNLPFTAQADSGRLEFVHTATGDASLVLDAVSIVERAADEIVIRNPSFEASGSPGGVGYNNPFAIAGWESTGGRGINVDGEGPFSDNGDVPDQDRTGFIQSVGNSLSQLITGLTPGQRYTLVASVNARNCCGGVPVVSISMADVALVEEELPPVGGRNPFHVRYLGFTAAADSETLRFAIVGPEGADVSLLIDDVHIVPGDRTPPVITGDPSDTEVQAGATIDLAGSATGSNLRYVWRRNGVPLVNGGRVSGANTAALRITGAVEADAGNYTLLVTDGLGVFSTAAAVVTVIPSQERPELRAVLVPAGVQLRWPASVAGFRLQRSAAIGGNWTDENAPVVVDGADNAVTVPADGNAYFRLAN